MRILALDVAAGLVRAAVLEVATATPVGPIARFTYALDHPTPEAVEVPAERLWSAVTAAARQATKGMEGIEGIGLCLTPALVLLDGADRPLAPIWMPLDRRARPAARQVWAAAGKEFLTTTGNRPLPGGISAVCFRQMVSADPYLLHGIRSYLHVNSWLGLHLTGERAIDSANACFTGLYGTLTDQKWSERWCSYFEVDSTWLPPVVHGSATVGALRSAIATELGVPAGLPVKLGTIDTASAMVAAGMGPGDLLHIAGPTHLLATLAGDPKPDARRLTCRLGDTTFAYITHNPVGIVALDWLRKLCFREQSMEEFYGQSIPLARKHRTRITLDPAYLGGDQLEIEAHRAGFRDLTLATDRLDLLAGLLEAMQRKHREALAALGMGERLQQIFLSGVEVDSVRELIPEYGSASIHLLEEGSLRGVARLFETNR